LPHPDSIAALVVEKCRQCPCGAIADHPYGLCRKCRARIAWRRKAMRKSHRGSRRLAARHARTFIRFLADTMATSKRGVPR
jgi:hypothetical protein